MTEELPDMRASDTERERVAEVLREALAEGRLGMEEFQDRLDSAYKARTRGDLAPLVRDLPETVAKGRSGTAAPEESGGGHWVQRVGGKASSRWGVGILGGFTRRGNWTVPSVFTGVAIMGGGELDLREARFEEREVVLRCFTIMGGINIVVPPGVELEVRGLGIMGGFDSSLSGQGQPGAPRVVVTGFAFWGGVGSERKAPRGERKRLHAEHRRQRDLEREERRQLRGHGQPHSRPDSSE